MVITKDQILKQLIEFFIDDLRQDAAGVGDWLAQGDYDVDEFITAVFSLKELMIKLEIGNKEV